MKIFTSPRNETQDSFLVLTNDSWDDYGLRSTFRLTVYLDGVKKEVGELKLIDDKKQTGQVSFEEGLPALPENYCSLGQNVNYYKALHRLGQKYEKQILEMLRDCTYDREIYDRFEELPQFRSSAIRFSTAEQALKYGQELHSRFVGPQPVPSYSFDYNTALAGFEGPHELGFQFFDKSTSAIPSNINVLIGRNGTGKTQLLSDLAKSISGYGYESKAELLAARAEKFPGGRPAFGNVIVVSYSAFDSFEIPGKTEIEKTELAKQGHIFGYKYCGLRERTPTGEYRIKAAHEVTGEFLSAIGAIEKRGDSDKWQRCLRHILCDPSFSHTKSSQLVDRFSKLSSGQKIILSIFAKICEHIEPASIVIVDEPETHLHPSLISALMHALREILSEYNSYGLIATHSPVILQETPSKFVQVLAGSLSRPKVKRLKAECFGEEVSTLTEEVFGLSFEESNFYSVLRDLSKEGRSLDEINALFGKKLGITARSFIANSYH